MKSTKHRTWMAAILAGVALIFGIEAARLWRFSAAYARKAAHFAELSAGHLEAAEHQAREARRQKSDAEMLRRHRLPEGFVEALGADDRGALVLLTEMAKTTMIANNLLNDLYARFAARCDASAREQFREALDRVKVSDRLAARRREYERAARHPWFAAPPDEALLD